MTVQYLQINNNTIYLFIQFLKITLLQTPIFCLMQFHYMKRVCQFLLLHGIYKQYISMILISDSCHLFVIHILKKSVCLSVIPFHSLLNLLNIVHAGSLMSTLGKSKTLEELEDMVNSVDTSKTGTINFQDFLER